MESNNDGFDDLFGDLGNGDIDLDALDADTLAAQLADEEYGDDFVIDDVPKKSETYAGASRSGLREMGEHLGDMSSCVIADHSDGV